MTEAATATAPEKPSQAASEKARKLAAEHLKTLKKTGLMQRTSSMEIGWQARIMKTSSEFDILGMEEDDVREQVGVERSTWYTAIQIASGFQKLKKREFVKMSFTKAKALLQLPESERVKAAWYNRACDPKISTADLVEMIERKLTTGEVKQDATVAEEREWFKVRLYKKDFEILTGKLEAYCKKNGLKDNLGQALMEIILEKGEEMLSPKQAEGAKKLHAVLDNKGREFVVAIKLFRDAKRPDKDRVEAIERVIGPLVVEMAEALGVKY